MQPRIRIKSEGLLIFIPVKRGAFKRELGLIWEEGGLNRRFMVLKENNQETKIND